MMGMNDEETVSRGRGERGRQVKPTKNWSRFQVSLSDRHRELVTKIAAHDERPNKLTSMLEQCIDEAARARGLA